MERYTRKHQGRGVAYSLMAHGKATQLLKVENDVLTEGRSLCPCTFISAQCSPEGNSLLCVLELMCPARSCANVVSSRKSVLIVPSLLLLHVTCTDFVTLSPVYLVL